MKHFITLIFIILLFPPFLFSQEKDTMMAMPKTHLIGQSKDKHGCYTTAGYCWSSLRKTCIRLWESGQRFNPVTKNDRAVLSAFAVFSDDSAQVEIFMPNKKKTTLLHKIAGKQQWVGKALQLKHIPTQWYLEKRNGTKLFTGVD
ncbi:MAG: hypothetical protein QM528_09200 [Phycisphaerales bacterium]|nr:hypothetical protein [Phycisphaerales bacterium]